MQFTTSCIAAVLAFTASVSAAPLEARQDLQDWQVTSVSWDSPSGRPGSYPWASLRANVTDPNTINLGPAKSDGSDVVVPAGSQGINCEAQWFTKGESPLGRTWPCDPVADGYWVMNVLAGASGFSTSDFNLKFTHKADVLYQGSEYNATFEATGNFGVGKNMAGTCGGSGVCGWGLKPESKPVLIEPKQV